MPKVIAGASTLNDVCGQGGVDYAAWLILGGLLLDQVLTNLTTRFPSATEATLTEVYGLAEQSIQAGTEIMAMGPGEVNPPSGIPGVPGVQQTTYMMDVVTGTNIEGEPVTLARKIIATRPITREELIELVNQQIRKDFEKDTPELRQRIQEIYEKFEAEALYVYQPGYAP